MTCSYAAAAWQLDGSAAKSLEGKRVKIVFDDGRPVASATVGKNGQFSTTAPLPPANLRDSNDARYQAESGSQRSLNLKLVRRLSLEPPKVSGDTVTLVGQVLPPLTKPVAQVTVQQELECGKTNVVAHAVPSASGRFRITVTVPTVAKAGVYRLISDVARTRTRRAASQPTACRCRPRSAEPPRGRMMFHRPHVFGGKSDGGQVS